MKTRHCDECNHFGAYNAALRGHHSLCLKGHRPRFYLPTTPGMNNDWGYKSKCEDFAVKK